MSIRTYLSAVALVASSFLGANAFAQQESYFEVTQSLDTISILQGSSKQLKFAYDIPELMVENPDIIQATPMRSNEIMVSGMQPGHTSLTVSDASSRLHTIKVIVSIDTRALEMAYENHFPDSRIKVSPLKQGIILTGFVGRDEQIEAATRVANDFVGTNVINQLSVQSIQNVAIEIQVYEISRSKLRRLGVDWDIAGTSASFASSVSDLLSGTNLEGRIVGDSTTFRAFVQFLEQRDVARLMAKPVLIAHHGRPAEFLDGGEVPILISQGLGTNSIEFRPFGTKLDIVPLIEGNGLVTLQVRAEVSEKSDELGVENGTPGFTVRRVNTGVTMRTGHTLALAGHYRERNATRVRGIPKLMDLPALGTAFRQTQDDFKETELLFLLTPNYISDVDASQLPNTFPGQLTTAPSDRELFLNAHNEVPKCQDDCPVPQHFGSAYPIHQPAAPYGSYAPPSTPQPYPPSGQYPPQIPPQSQHQTKQPPVREASRAPGFNWPQNRR